MSAVMGEAAGQGTTPVPGDRVVVMGVSGCGKSTVGALLATELDGTFVDGDALHPQANIEKMSAGIALDDEDREPWLRQIGVQLGQAAAAGRTLVIGCSALKRSYRDLIRAAAPDTRFVHLHGTEELLRERMQVRPGHFMPASLLDSQLATLEKLAPDEAGRMFDIADSPAQLASDAAAWLGS
ncbi:gluconokinase [Arthrobacter sp.]|uniref:gluconokinase n=1 Tax=Arthrobacter sp. TaxID=1667 RepID=UPI003A951A85